MSRKGYVNLSMVLMLISSIMITLAFIYYRLEDEVINYRYSDIREYSDINEGIKFIERLPIQFNIINQYFSNMNNLGQKEKEEIVAAYALKNRIKQFNCGPSTASVNYSCVKVEDLNGEDIQKAFNLDLKFEANKIELYLDDYGTQEMTNKEDPAVYKYVVNVADNNNYRLYTKFEHFKQSEDSYIFYVYQGYIKANIKANESLSLYDFMTGEAVYTGQSNGFNDFSGDITKDVVKLQKYKYELKKHDDGTFYLYGYNPVKS